MESFGKWLLDKRKAARLTQGQIAQRAGISTSYVSTIEREERHHLTNAPPRPAIDVVEAIAKALDAPIDEARLAAGYAPRHVGGPPANVTEFLTALEALGVDGIRYVKGIENLTPDEYRDLLHDVALAVEVSLRRRSQE